MHYHMCETHSNDPGESDCATCIIADLEGRILELEEVLGNVLQSATPHRLNHPTMYAAWKRAQATLESNGHPITDQCLN